MPILYLIRGVPGSGKSTLANDFRQAGLVDVIAEADAYFMRSGHYLFNPSELSVAHKECQKVTELALQAGMNVAVSNTSTTEKEVEVYKKIAEKYNAEFVSIIVENRHEGENAHGVPEEKINQMRQRFSVKL